MATNKYSNGKVYRLVNNVDNQEYVGSTTQTLIQRKGGHKRKAVVVPNRRVYQHLNNVGWDNVEIILIESYPCQTKEELNARERHWIDTLKPSLNKVIPLRTHRESQKAYDIANADTIKEYQREYRQKNAEKIKEGNREYRQQNADKIAEKQREYRLRKKADREAQH